MEDGEAVLVLLCVFGGFLLGVGSSSEEFTSGRCNALFLFLLSGGGIDREWASSVASARFIFRPLRRGMEIG